jgi:hypothetical protein
MGAHCNLDKNNVIMVNIEELSEEDQRNYIELQEYICDNPPRKIPYYHLNQSTLAIKRQSIIMSLVVGLMPGEITYIATNDR